MKRFVFTGLIILGIFAYFWYSDTPEYQMDNIAELWNSIQGEEGDGDSQTSATGFDDEGLFLAGKQTRRLSREQSLRIATFNVEFTPEKQNDVAALARLAQIVKQFDVVAVQGLRASNRRSLNSFMELVNHDGERFTYVLGPKSDSSDHAHQFAFIYNLDKVACDTQSVYAVDDPDHIFHHPPVVAWFMTQSAKQEQAFTFSLVNILVDSQNARNELAVFGQLYRAIRDDSRGEDDVIMLGDLQSADKGLQYLKKQSRLQWIVKNETTDTLARHQNSNILFYPPASVEFTAEGGVYDFLKELNLTMDEAMRVSSQLPVWAEFKMREGNSPGRIAFQSTGVA